MCKKVQYVFHIQPSQLKQQEQDKNADKMI